jgi:hypothetical protein
MYAFNDGAKSLNIISWLCIQNVSHMINYHDKVDEFRRDHRDGFYIIRKFIVYMCTFYNNIIYNIYTMLLTELGKKINKKKKYIYIFIKYKIHQ